ncbi:hypothetical protein PHJA_001700200 [Phtheirospermum japonicum]|uniref:Uncharacterized protein n=1 Tax=Phtheirospermum japonicum TaxID=374723 RepID=A0A830C8F2_9LAMI|nr:hypothetical protein PHJA_001700200 [Phtheirospermum japonicum]
MPPSPAMRISPRRDLRAENHKRGRSLEGGFLFRDKDDDLALFNEVQSKERENFLLQSNDDFDDIFSTKLRHFSDNKHGVSIPARGEGSDLLNAEGDKNDYDWLITPPETPLFSSLDDEAPSASLARRGRPRSQPITISRSSTMEKGYRSARSSASPHRLSPSPRSVNSTLQSRSSRPFSTNHSSPPPSRRLSPSPSKPTPPPRTSTPTPRRMSTGSAGPTPQSRARGPSPVKTTRGNSSSPKISAWQSNIPGFSSEAPPNLRTSLADRPASYVRGSSPASRNGFRSGRQSMSPTASRSVSSSHSHERDQFSSHSKGSVVSSGDDDMDSLQSNPVSVDRSVPRSVGAYPNNRAMGLSKKANKVVSSSAPKRSFDLALRQMERKGPPQNMFRPLLSSVPSSTFYVGKGNAHHRALTSKNSSITTSSNASSDQGTSGALDIEESEQTQEDVTSVFTKGRYPTTTHDEIFDMDQPDASDEPVENRIIENDEPSAVVSDVVPDRESDAMALCSKCSRSFHSSKLIREGDMWLCLECKSSEINSTTIIPVNAEMVDNNATGEFVQILECGLLDVLDCDNEKVKEQIHSIEDLDISTVEEGELNITTQQEINQSVGPSGVCSNIAVDVSEGTGISLLLKRSSSGKGHIVQSRSFTASNISYEDFSYTRDSVNSMRSSIGHSSASVSSSFDLGTRIHRQSSGRKSDTENYRHETPVKHRRSASSLSGSACGHVFLEVPSVNPHERSLASECTDAESTYTDIESRLINNVYSGDNTSVVSEELASHENGDNLTNVSSNSIIEEISAEISTQEDGVMQSLCVEKVDIAEAPQTSALGAISEIEIENADIVVSADPQSDVDSTTSKSCTNELKERSDSFARNDVITMAVEEIDVSVPANGVLEESTVVLEDLGGTKPRSLTLEEATDAILFCSSIVHNLAYEAANIAIGKDDSPVEALRPAVTFVGKSNSDRREMRSRATGRRSSKSQKVRQRKLETDNTKPPSVVAESDEKPISQRIVRSPSKGDSMNPPKLESKCNCVIM